MSHQEPMDIDNMESDFDKENKFSNLAVGNPNTDKGFEEVDVSELNIKLRYSMTPNSSPMSKSYTKDCLDNKKKNSDSKIDNLVTKSLQGSDISKHNKYLPLQSVLFDPAKEINMKHVNATSISLNNVNESKDLINNFDDNWSLPSSSSTTPEVSTPNELPKADGTSPIIRGLKSVLNMFRSSPSPIPPDLDNKHSIEETYSPVEDKLENCPDNIITPISKCNKTSTPETVLKLTNVDITKNRSDSKDSVTFNEDLQKNIQWNDETTIIFSGEKVPVHKLFFPNNKLDNMKNSVKENKTLNETTEFMDISYNNSYLKKENKENCENSDTDNEFQDCETTLKTDEIKSGIMVENTSQNFDSIIDGIESVTEQKPTDLISNTLTSENFAQDKISKDGDSKEDEIGPNPVKNVSIFSSESSTYNEDNSRLISPSKENCCNQDAMQLTCQISNEKKINDTTYVSMEEIDNVGHLNNTFTKDLNELITSTSTIKSNAKDTTCLFKNLPKENNNHYTNEKNDYSLREIEIQSSLGQTEKVALSSVDSKNALCLNVSLHEESFHTGILISSKENRDQVESLNVDFDSSYNQIEHNNSIRTCSDSIAKSNILKSVNKDESPSISTLLKSENVEMDSIDPSQTNAKNVNESLNNDKIAMKNVTCESINTCEETVFEPERSLKQSYSTTENDITHSSLSSDESKNITVQDAHTVNENMIEENFVNTENTKILSSKKLCVNESPILFETGDTDTNEIYIDAQAYEFLMNQNNHNEIVDSGKESLFLKFDPLYDKKSRAESIRAALASLQQNEATPKKVSENKPFVKETDDSEVKCSSSVDGNEEPNSVSIKPMMIVSPAVNPMNPKNIFSTPTRTGRISSMLTSPALAVIDRLLSMNSNSPQSHYQTQNERRDAELILEQNRELLAEKEMNVHHLKIENRELSQRLTALEKQVEALNSEGKSCLQRIEDLNEKLTKKTKENKSMVQVVEEYEKTIASLITKLEEDKREHELERRKLIKERDEQTSHLASMEVSFSDLISKYEKSKQVIINYKKNEMAYNESIRNYEENLEKMQANYDSLKQHATAKLNEANEELEKINMAHESELLKLNTMIKRKDLHISSLEKSLAHKSKENEELSSICDALISKFNRNAN